MKDPTLRDHVRSSLSASEPDDREAQRELATVMRRSTRVSRAWFVVPAFAAAVGIAVALYGSHRAPNPQPQAVRGVHLYLRAEGEPESRAITLDLEQD